MRWFSAAGNFLLRTKLFWGLAALYSAGILLSPVNRRGVNIFLSLGNQSDVLRQVSNNGLIAVGMTLVILAGGIDLSVGSMMALGSVVCAMLLTESGWTNAALLGVPAVAVVVFAVSAAGFIFVTHQWMAGRGGRPTTVPRNVLISGGVVGLVLAVLAVAWTTSQLNAKFGLLGVLITVPAVGLLAGTVNGIIISLGKMQPFIVTLATMVAMLGLARLLGGANAAVHPVYSGSNATEEFDILRALIFQVVPVPGIFFIIAATLFGGVLKTTTFGRYLFAVGGNEQSAKLAGIQVNRIKIAVYGLSGLLSSLAGVLYTAQYRQGKADAGAGAELDAIAAVVIGGTTLSGGRGSILGTVVGVLIFGFLGNILQLKNIDSNTQLVLKGVIILVAVLLQEDQLGIWWRQFRSNLPSSNPPEKNSVKESARAQSTPLHRP